MAFDARAFFVRFITALNEQDFVTVEALTHPDFVIDSPQSGERARGVKSWETQLREYPDVDKIVIVDAQVVDREERWAITPSYTVVPLASPNEFTTVLRTQYPDGSWWRVVSLVELRDDKLYRMEAYYAPEMAAPLAETIGRASPG